MLLHAKSLNGLTLIIHNKLTPKFKDVGGGGEMKKMIREKNCSKICDRTNYKKAGLLPG